MAAQDYNTISQPSLGVDANTLSLVVSKDDKKQRQELAHLATILMTVQEELVSAKSGAALGGAEAGPDVSAAAPSEGPSNSSLEDVLAKMAGALQLLQVKIAKYASSKASSESTISEAEKQIAEDNLNKANDALKKLQEEIYKQEHMSFWEKLGEALAGLVLTIVAIVTMQPELLIAAVLCFAGAAGLLSKASDLIAEGLEALGVPANVAQILGGIIVTILVIALTAGAGSLAGVETAAASAADDAMELGEDAIEMTDMAANATEEVSEVTSDSSNLLSKATQVLKKLNFFRNFSARTNLMIMAGAQSATQTNVISEIAGSIAYAIVEAKGDKKDAEKMKQEVEMITGIIVALMTILVSAGAGSAMGEAANTAANAASETAENTSLGSKVFSAFQELGLSANGQRLFGVLNVLSQLEVAGTGIAAGAYQIEQGEGEIALSKYQADTILNNIAIGMNNNEMKSSQEFMAQREKQFKTSDKAIMGTMKGMEAFSQLLSSSMV